MSDIPDIKIKLADYARIPEKAHDTDSGRDLFVYSFKKVFGSNNLLKAPIDGEDNPKLILLPGERALIDTGIFATVGIGYEIQIRPRSGLALENGLTVLNTPGTIDEGYRGPICVIIINHSGVPQIISKDDKIAQMVVCPVVLGKIQIVSDLDETDRNDGGFGSTGV
jgi:dUTP pyrophosphatase